MNHRVEKCPVYLPTDDVSVPEPSQERDFAMVRYIYEYDGILTKDQIQSLVQIPDRQFSTRIRYLVEHGYVHRFERWKVKQYNFRPYWLAKRGAAYVAGLAGEARKWRDYCFRESRKWKGVRLPRLDNLIHDVRIVDFRLQVEANCLAEESLALFQWQKQSHFKADPDKVSYTRRNGTHSSRNFIPDGYYIVDHFPTNRRYRFLFEMDNGVKDGNKMLDEKLLIGSAYVSSPLYQRRFNSTQGWFTFVCADDRGESLNRVKLLKSYIEHHRPDHAPYFFFTTLELTQEHQDVMTAPIWWRGDSSDPVPLISTR